MSGIRAVERLTKWRRVFAAWQLGKHALTGDNQQVSAQVQAVRHHRELSMILRAEANAVAALMIEKGVFTAEELTAQIEVEATHLDVQYEGLFPGFVAGDDGLTLELPDAAKTMSRWAP